MSKIKLLQSIEGQFKDHYAGYISPVEYFSMEDEEVEQAYYHFLSGYKRGNDLLYQSGTADIKMSLLTTVFHSLALAYSSGNQERVKSLLDTVADWSYSIRRSDCNGEAGEEEQLANIERAWSHFETQYKNRD